MLQHCRQHVAVKIERNSNLAVPEPLAGDLRMGGRSQKVRGVTAPQIVKPDARRARPSNCLHPCVAKAIGLDTDPLSDPVLKPARRPRMSAIRHFRAATRNS
jgi:hypothetical protein